MEHAAFVFDFGLFKKQKAKKKKEKKTNFIYKVKLKPRINGKRQDLWGRGKAGPEPIPHSEHTEPGTGAGFFWHVWGSWNSVHWQTWPHTRRSLALTLSLRWPGSPLPKNLLLEPAGFVPSIRALTPSQTPHLPL